MSRSKQALGIFTYWLGLILATYLTFAEEYMVIFFAGAILIRLRNTRRLKMSMSTWVLFVVYYIFVTILGLARNTTSVVYGLELISKYVCMPMTLYILMPKKKQDIFNLMKLFRNFIIISAIYGLIEGALKYNIMEKLVVASARSWMLDMANRSNYQVCSFFLHYNYYGCILLVGWVLIEYLPLGKRMLNTAAKLLIAEQIIMCQSRIAWISFIVVTLYFMFRSRRITRRKAKLALVVIAIGIIVLLINPILVEKIETFFVGRFERLFIYGMKDGSLGQRLGTLLNWPEYLSKNIFSGIFGTGYKSVEQVYMQEYSYFKGYSTADCEVTVYLVETGLIGILIFLSALAKTLFQKERHNQGILIQKAILLVFIIECMTLDIAAYNVLLSILCLLLIAGSKLKPLSIVDGRQD